MKNSFRTLGNKIYEVENEESNPTRSDSEDIDGDSHFQFHNNVVEPQKGFQMFHTERNNCNQTPGVGVVLQQAPGKCIKKLLLEKKHAEFIDLNLKKVILLYSQSIMDLFCNE